MENAAFTFPKNCFLFNGTISNRREDGWFTNIDILKPKDNLISINGIDYCFTYLNGAESGNKGGNSIILRLYDIQSIDVDNPIYDEPDMILKIAKYKKNFGRPRKNDMRFKNEIDCLQKANKFSQNVVQAYHFGECKLAYKNKLNVHDFYTMEFAPYDLKKYIEDKHYNLDLETKISLCISLCNGLFELREMGIYHRDIKPDNIFFTYNDMWKIGDLGLASEQNGKIDEIADFIGPKGWLSPEAMNKYLCEEKGFIYKHNCNIDHQSDIFQLGKIFWYIFQYNSPEGCMKESDFLANNSQIYRVIRTMLNHSKQKRFKKIEDVVDELKRIELSILRRAA